MFIYLAIGAYFLNALSFIVDKYLLTAHIPRPLAYAFWVSALSVVAVALIPFGVTFISLMNFGWSVLSGAAFFAALILFYTAVRHGEISISATTTGVFTVLFTYVFSYMILGELLTGVNLYAFASLAIGIAFLGFAGKRILKYAIPSGLCFALALVVIKLMFNELGFINGLFWTRVGFVLSAFAPLLVSHSVRNEVVASFHKAAPGSRLALVLNKGLVGTGFVLLYIAIQQGDVVIVNALQGLQFMFVILLTLAVRRWFPGFEHEKDKLVTSSKIAGIFFVVVGFLLFII